MATAVTYLFTTLHTLCDDVRYDVELDLLVDSCISKNVEAYRVCSDFVKYFYVYACGIVSFIRVFWENPYS